MEKNLYYDTSVSENMGTLQFADPTIATPSDVEAEYLFRDSLTREVLIGTVPRVESEIVKLNPWTEGSETEDSEYYIQYGIHSGAGKVYVGPLSEYTVGNAQAKEIAQGKVAWVNGKRIVGTLDYEENAQTATATADDIIENKTAWVNRKKITGNIRVLPRQDKTLLAGETYVVPKGYSNGTSVITSASLSSQTPGNAIESDITSGKIAWVNGVKILGTFNLTEKIKETLASANALQKNVLSGTKFYSAQYDQVVLGSMPDHSNEAQREINAGETYIIPEGYYDGISSIKAKSLPDTTPGTAEANDILNGKTAWVNGEKITGEMPYIETTPITLRAGEEFYIPEGYHLGAGKILAADLVTQTPGDAFSKDILSGKTAWVNGEQVTGSMPTYNDINVVLDSGHYFYFENAHYGGAGWVYAKSIAEQTAGDTVAKDLLEGKIAWVNGEQIIGEIPNAGDMSFTLEAGEEIFIPEGYYNGNGKIIVKPIGDITEGTATASDILKDKTAWVNGRKITGTIDLVGTADTDQVFAGCTFYNTDANEIRTGTFALRGSATEDNVLKGETFFSNSHEMHTGTLELTGDSLASHVLEGKIFYNTDPKNPVVGTMPNNPDTEYNVYADQVFFIPEGYHSGNSIVRGASIKDQTEATATAADIAYGKTAWSNGKLLNGSMVLNGTTTPDKVLEGTTFYSNDPRNMLEGAMPNNGTKTATLLAGETFQIQKGYHSGEGVIKAATLSSQTMGTATASDITYGKTAWVNGEKVTGTMETHFTTTITIEPGTTYILPKGLYASDVQIIAPVSAYVGTPEGVKDPYGDTAIFGNHVANRNEEEMDVNP